MSNDNDGFEMTAGVKQLLERGKVSAEKSKHIGKEVKVLADRLLWENPGAEKIVARQLESAANELTNRVEVEKRKQQERRISGEDEESPVGKHPGNGVRNGSNGVRPSL